LSHYEPKDELYLTFRTSSLQKLMASGCLFRGNAAWKAELAAEAAGEYVSH